jgi:hypothetical protein
MGELRMENKKQSFLRKVTVCSFTIFHERKLTMSSGNKRGATKRALKHATGMNRMERRMARYDKDRARREANYARGNSLSAKKLWQKHAAKIGRSS